jgi:hypothetical protein
VCVRIKLLSIGANPPHFENRLKTGADRDDSRRSGPALLCLDHQLVPFQRHVPPLKAEDFSRAARGFEHGNDHRPKMRVGCVQQALLLLVTLETPVPWRLPL